MVLAVQPDLMSVGDDPSEQLRLLSGSVHQDEEGGAHPGCG